MTSQIHCISPLPPGYLLLLVAAHEFVVRKNGISTCMRGWSEAEVPDDALVYAQHGHELEVKVLCREITVENRVVIR